MSTSVQFYGRHTATGERRIFSFKVENYNDAVRALERFNVPAGWFVIRKGNSVVKNQKISNRKYIANKPETFFDRLDKFFQL